MTDVPAELKELSATLASIEAVLDVPKLRLQVEELEKQVAELSGKAGVAVRKKDPRRTFGIFKGDPDFQEAVRLGREYREKQTYEKEIPGS